MKELTTRAESLERRELLARCRGSLLWRNVRRLAREGDLDLARAAYVSVRMEGSSSPFAGVVGASRGVSVKPRTTAIYWGNRRYAPGLARQYWGDLFT